MIQHSVSQLKKTLCILIAAQVCCLALGLWIHHRFILSTAEWQAQQASTNPESSPEPITDSTRSASATNVARTTDTAIVDAQVLFQAMPVANLIAFLWIAGLQAAVAYLVVSRVDVENAREQMQSRDRSLQRTNDLLRTRDAVIFGLAKLAESRDPDTGHHLERIALYATQLTVALSRSQEWRQQISPAFVRLIGISSALHDIGKVGVEDAILLKPGSLNEEERLQMQLHSTVGGKCIREIEQRLGDSNFLEMAREIALYHHERWDGTGYPKGLAGVQIPLAARIVAVADVYDALSSRRVYKDAYPHQKCVAMIQEAAGKQFDPEIVDVFLIIQTEFHRIAQQFSDFETPVTENSFEEVKTEKTTSDLRMTNAQEAVLASVLELDERLLSPMTAAN